MIDQAPHGVVLSRADGRFDYVNRRFAAMHGCSQQELAGRQPWDFLDEAEEMRARAGLKSRQKGRCEGYPLTWRHRDGQQVPSMMTLSPFLGPDGSFEGTLAMVVDFTEQLRTERNEREHDATLAAVTASMAEGLYAMDREGRLLMMKPGGRAPARLAGGGIARPPCARGDP